MKTTWLAAAGALLVCAGCAGTKEARPAPSWAAGKEMRQGRVFTISDERMSLFDPARPGEDVVVLRITDATAFVRGGESVQRADVEEGAPVRVYFEPGAEDPHATRVELVSKRRR
jgi:hypothetical protein